MGAGLLFVTAAVSVSAAWAVVMPRLDRMSLRPFRAPADRRRAVKRLGLGSAYGFVAGGASGAVLGLGFASALLLVAPGAVGAADPRDVMRGNLVFGTVFGIVLGFVSGGSAPVVLGGIDPQDAERRFDAELVCVPAFALAAGLLFGIAGVRYAALLLCTRRWNRHRLPWRLGRFLHWCYGAGLLRLAGTAYQLRHRELQDHLASRARTP